MTKHQYRRVVPYLAFGLLAVSCNHPPKKVVEIVSPDPFSVATSRDRYADDLGRFLAGLPARTGSPFSELEKQPAWIKHRRELDRDWSRIEEASLDRKSTRLNSSHLGISY